MLKCLEGVGEYDALFFMPFKNTDELFIQTNRYKKPGKPLDGSDIGPAWHIILYRSDGSSVSDLDQFEAIFSDPREYISGLIPQGWFGVVAKKTTTSGKFISEVIAKLKTLM